MHRLSAILRDVASGEDDYTSSALGPPESRSGAGPPVSEPHAGIGAAMPGWFADFLIDRATRKPSEHTMTAYRQDFALVAALLTGGSPADIALHDITKANMRAAFAAYASSHEPASIRRCWSTWNVLCDFLYTAELIPANPMPFVGRPKAAKTLPRSLPRRGVDALLQAVDGPHESSRRTDWAERDLALILTALLAGLRLDELRRADVGDIRTATGDGAVIYVRGKSGKDRAVPIEADVLAVIENYLDSRAIRFPGTTRFSIRSWRTPRTAKDLPSARQDYWRLAHRLLHDPDIATVDRVAGSFVLLYGQQLSRIVAMTRSQVHDRGDSLSIRIWNRRRRNRRAC